MATPVMENWRDVNGYSGIYEVSNTGRVARICNGTRKIRKPCKDRAGYLNLCLSKNGKEKTFRVHRLVADAFIPNPNGLKEINHKDEDKTNNNVCNLEWCTRAYNVRYGTRTSKTATKVGMYSISGDLVAVYAGIREACRANGFRSPAGISRVLKKKRKTAYGFKWEEI